MYTTILFLFVVLCVVRIYLTPRTWFSSGFQQTDSCELSPLESHHRRVRRRPRIMLRKYHCHRCLSSHTTGSNPAVKFWTRLLAGSSPLQQRECICWRNMRLSMIGWEWVISLSRLYTVRCKHFYNLFFKNNFNFFKIFFFDLLTYCCVTHILAAYSLSVRRS